MRRTITTEEVIQAFLDTHKASTYHQLPGAVVAYYPKTQTADVLPMVTDPRLDLDTGGVVFEPWSVIQSVPVEWPRFGNGYCIAGFLEANDQVVLRAFDLDTSTWRAQGRSKNPVNPADIRRQGGGYWSCIPTDLTGPLSDSDVVGGSSLVIGFGGGATIVVSGMNIKIGENALTVALAGGLPAQGAARTGDLAGGMFPIVAQTLKVFVGG